MGALSRSWRERALLTQEELVGLSVRTVRRWESGELRQPQSASLRLYAEALGLDAAEPATLTQAASGAAHPDARVVALAGTRITDAALLVRRARR
ncbi:helix-turn-helix transcriptional regulator [Nonomuraea sp. NPDC005650]|uniref:helix-turn-helix domain-containing protein n=1 Tax=Nonomuraea sp. NPDC005650 TaxID=3157045 RepID=UPI0033B235DC